MAKFTMTHDLECSVERFWALSFDREFNDKMYAALDFPDWKLLDVTETDKEIVRRVRATPKMDAPGPVVKLLGSSFSYTEEDRFDRAAKIFRFVITPSTLADKLKNEGIVRCEPRGEGKSRRVVDVVVEAKIFGIGGMLESSIEKTTRSGWAKSAEFINKWVKDHP